MDEPANKLTELRNRIDELDSQLLSLLNARAEIVMQIQEIKRDMGLPPRSLERENAIVRQLRNGNPGPLSNHAIKRIFKIIIRVSLHSIRQRQDWRV